MHSLLTMMKLNSKNIILFLVGISVAAFLSLFGTILQIYAYLPVIFLASSVEPYTAPMIAVLAVSSLGFASEALTPEALVSVFLAVFCCASLASLYFFVMDDSNKIALYVSAIFLGSALALSLTWDPIFLLFVFVSAVLLDRKGNLKGLIQLGTVSILVFVPFSVGLIARILSPSIFGTSVFSLSTNFAQFLSGRVSDGSSILSYLTIPDVLFYCFFVFLILAFLTYRAFRISRAWNPDLFVKLRKNRLVFFVILILTFSSFDTLFASATFAFERATVYEALAIVMMMTFLKTESFPSSRTRGNSWFSRDTLLGLGLFLYIANLPYWHLVLPLELSGGFPSSNPPQFLTFAPEAGVLLIIASIFCIVLLAPAIVVSVATNVGLQVNEPYPIRPMEVSITQSQKENIESPRQFPNGQAGRSRVSLELETKDGQTDTKSKNERVVLDPDNFSLVQRARGTRKTADLIELLWAYSKREFGKDSLTLSEIVDHLQVSGRLREDNANDLKVELNAYIYSKTKRDRIPLQLFTRCLDAIDRESST